MQAINSCCWHSLQCTACYKMLTMHALYQHLLNRSAGNVAPLAVGVSLALDIMAGKCILCWKLCLKLSHLLAYLPAACPSGWLVGYPDARLLPVICQAVTCHLSSCYLLHVLCYLPPVKLLPVTSPVTCYLSPVKLLHVPCSCYLSSCHLFSDTCPLLPATCQAVSFHLSPVNLLPATW